MLLLPRDEDSALARYESVPLLNNRSPLLALTIVFITISWICTLLRLYVRLLVQRAPGWDDFFLTVAMISTTIGSVVLCIMTNIGLGKPIFTLTLAERQTILRTMYIATATYPMSITFIKVALLLQYLRFFTGSHVRLLCKIVLALTVISGIAFGACSWFSCYPVQSFWDFTVTGGRCWGFASRDRVEFMRISVAQVVIMTVSSLVVFLIPAWMSFRPGTKKTAQLSMFGLFVLGLCAIICSFWRAGFIIKLTLIDGDEFDPVWDNPTVMGLACYEAHLAAVCGALPIFWPIIKETWNRMFVTVTYEVHVTEEYESFPSRGGGGATDLELQSTSSDRCGPVVESTLETTWEPFVGDETTGLGKNTTLVEAPNSVKWPTKVKGVLLKD